MDNIIQMSAFRKGRTVRQQVRARPPDDDPAEDRITFQHGYGGSYQANIGGLYADDPLLVVRSILDLLVRLVTAFPHIRDQAMELLGDTIRKLAIAAQASAIATK
ncbi:hypothetical protein [Cupriavidus basilensis]|uniref:hypothetical protein n=1 Tax=Cupriavidus basilensis TaxID=68895 RepID=UPI0007516101|nr:hypothetical protein [Cupriavidus basilensis]